MINAYFPIPAEGLSIVAAHLVSFVASATVASSLLSSGIISAKDVVLTMLVADVISTITVMRWLIPYYIIWNKNRSRNHAHCDFNKNKYHDRYYILAPSSLVIIPD